MKKLASVLLVYLICFLMYSIFSYSLTAPNLVLSSWQPYWRFQTWMWATFFNNRFLLTYAYAGLISLLTGVYFFLIQQKNLTAVSKKISITYFFILISVLLLASNALSYDIFNYIFNARMILIYHANPHVHAALEYSFDLWTRFMHNTHTPAPYGYGWTVLSLIPYLFGMGKFLLTWISFKIFSALSILLLWITYVKLTPQKPNNLSTWLILLNPLLLIEVVGNSHNDLWMMVPAMVSFLILSRSKKLSIQWPQIGTSLFLLLLSISIKYATFVIGPIWLLLVFNRMKWFTTQKRLIRLSNLTIAFWPFFCSLLLFLPLLTSQSQQFHPWYLSWILVWIPLFSQPPDSSKSIVETKLYALQNLWKSAIIALSISSLFRYLPYLLVGEYTSNVLLFQKYITWLPFIGFLLFVSIYQKYSHRA